MLSADFARLAEQMQEVESSGLANWIHVDVMDGCFVPNLTIGPLVVEALKRSTKLPLDVHLMISEPGRLIPRFIAAGADYVTVHIEACPHISRDLDLIRAQGARAGVSLNPGTPHVAVKEVLAEVDLVLVMTVNPGFGAQAFMPGVVPKIASLRALLDERPSHALLSVDGGVSAKTAGAIVTAGADVLVAGSAVFGHAGGITAGLRELRSSIPG